MLSLINEDMAIRLTEKNVIMYAMKHYENSQCLDIDEFYDDLKRINYIKRLLVRYKNTSELKERLILNHLIILFNVFPIVPIDDKNVTDIPLCYSFLVSY